MVHDVEHLHLLLEDLEVREVCKVHRLPVEFIESGVDEDASCPLRDGELKLGVIPVRSLNVL